MTQKWFVFIILIECLSGIAVSGQTTRPVTIQQFLKAALVRHPSVRAYQKLQEQKAAETRSLKAETLPKIDYTLTGAGYHYTPYRYRTLENGFFLTWDARKWLGKLKELGIAGEEIAKIQARQNRLELIWEVKEAFYQLIRVRQEQRIVAVSEAYLQHHLMVSQGLFRVGQIDQLDLYRTQAALAAAQEAVTTAKNKWRQWQIRLQNLTGLTVSETDSLALQAGELIVPVVSLDTLMAEVRRINPAVALLEQQIHETELREKLVRAGWLPTVAISGGFVLDNDPTSGGNYAVIQGGLQLPLVDWRQRKNKAESFRLHRQSLVETQKALLLDIRTRLQQLLAQQGYLKSLQVLKAKTLLQAAQAYFLTEKSYKAGLATNTDVLLAQKEWIQARLSQENIRLQLRLTNAKFDLLIGRTGVSK